MQQAALLRVAWVTAIPFLLLLLLTPSPGAATGVDALRRKNHFISIGAASGLQRAFFLVHKYSATGIDDEGTSDLGTEGHMDSWSLGQQFNDSAEEDHETVHDLTTPGLHLLILHQETGRILVQRSFKTSEPFSWWADLVWWIQQVVPGRFIVLTMSGFQNALGLRYARMLFADLGSLFIHYLGDTAMWVWAFVKSGCTIYEALVKGPLIKQDSSSARHSSNIVLAEGTSVISNVITKKRRDKLIQKRWQYCASEGALGNLCDDSNPVPLPIETKIIAGYPYVETSLQKIPIVITAGRRHQYLYYTIKSILCNPLAKSSNIHVVLGEASNSTIQLLHILDIHYHIIPIAGKDNYKLFSFYRSVYQFVADTFSRTKAVIILDEDVEVSPDFLNFVDKTIWLLHSDPSLYCISGFSFLPNVARGRGAKYLRRGSVQVSWGYAVTLQFVREALEVWPENGDGEDILTYDYWIYDKVRGQRECVYPEVSRIRHYGLGVNTQAFMHEYEAWYRPLLKAFNTDILNGIQMLQATHEMRFLKDIETATVIGQIDPCSPHFPPRQRTQNEHFVMYFSQEYDTDISSWYIVGQCTGLHAVSEQGHHYGAYFAFFQPRQPDYPSVQENYENHTHTKYPAFYKTPNHFPEHSADDYGMNYYNTEHERQEAPPVLVYFVGVPYSKYAYLRPNGAHVYNASSLSSEEFDAYRTMFLHSPDILLMGQIQNNSRALINQLFIK
ncbi:protein O-linked-mannose beta-1,2-N-acetylglucosaminyltransferase 1-like [Macrobrachium nipponense]|uniref:protein O-linked-mannose beta-1,2-N-acetylglucosaminyltransferase 1-like n=1 Tax=Macrobrachium nipponense TaxID=159736 RepID=UPI0030C7B12D